MKARLAPRLALLALATLGCTPAAPTSTGHAGAALASEPTPTPTDAPSVVAPELEPAAPLLVGWAERSFNHPKAALDHNKAGLKLHRAGDYAGGLAAFDEALATDPDYAWARYNRACALSRLARFDEAGKTLERLLREDLPTFGPRLDGDEDLAGLRESPAGIRLADQRIRITAAWAEALAAGVVAMSYRPREWDYDYERDVVLYDELRVGVYVASTRRFVPLSPDLDKALIGMVDREAGRVLLLTGRIIYGTLRVVQPRDVGVHLYDLAEPGRVLTELANVARGRKALQDELHGLAAMIEGDTVRLTYYDLGFASEHNISVRVSGSTVQVLADTGMSTPDSEFHIGRDHRRIHIDSDRAAVLDPSPADAGPLVFSQHSNCDGAKYTLARRDPTTAESTPLASGKVRAAAAIGPDGSIYLDEGENVVRFAPGQREPTKDVPDGVHFMTPEYEGSCNDR